MIIIKRDGRESEYKPNKIVLSILNASVTAGQKIDNDTIIEMVDIVEEKIKALNVEKLNVEKLQDIIQTAIYIKGYRLTKDAYTAYRKERNEVRETKSDIMKAIKKIGVHTDRDNGNEQ